MYQHPRVSEICIVIVIDTGEEICIVIVPDRGEEIVLRNLYCDCN